MVQIKNIELNKLKNNTGQITGLPKNPRLIKDDKYKKLVKSIQDDPEMLSLRELIIIPQNGHFVVIAGNMRLRAMQELNFKSAPCKILDKDTDPEKLKAYTIKDNIGYGEHEWEALANEWDLEQLTDWGLDIPDFVTAKEAFEDDYEIPDEIETDIVLGDLFEIGQHRLLCGDSTKADDVARLMNGQKADMVFTDPPFGMAYQSNAWDSKINEVQNKRTNKQQIMGDDNTNIAKNALLLIPLVIKNNIHFYIWCRWDCFNDFSEACKNVGKIKSVIVWDKGGPGLGDLKGSYGDSEWAIFGMIGRRELKERQNGVWQVNRMKGLNMKHPTQKPVELCGRAITNSSNDGELIADIFLGSGTTMVAAHQLNRKCYGMEIDPKYCQVIIDRMLKLDNTLEIKKNGVICDKTEIKCQGKAE